MDDPDQRVVSLKEGRSRGCYHHLEGDMLKYGVQLMFTATNNEAEYEAILTGLRIKKALGAKNLLL